MRWRAAGCLEPPDQRFLSRPCLMAGPEGEILVPLEATWLLQLLDVDRAHVLGVVIDHAWSDADPRTRVLAPIVLDEREYVQGDLGACFMGMVHLLLEGHRVQALRLERENEPWAGFLTSAQTVSVGAPGQKQWLHCDRRAVEGRGGCTQESGPSIAQAERDQLGAFGAGGWPGVPKPERRSGDFEVRVRDPSEAHLQLVQGSNALRSSFFRSGNDLECEVLIIGGGLSGLSAAYQLRDRRCLVAERADRIGGTAAAYDFEGENIALGAHYQCDLPTNWGSELIAFYKEVGVLEEQPTEQGLYRFAEPAYYVNPLRQEQSILPDGTIRKASWKLMEEHPIARHFRDALLEIEESFLCPTSLMKPQDFDESRQTFWSWLNERGFMRDAELVRSLNVGLVSDYAGGVDRINAFAGLHFFLCRPYLTESVGTFSPPGGLTYLARQLMAFLSPETVRCGFMVRRLRPVSGGVEAVALDLKNRCWHRVHAGVAIVASPKKALKYIFADDRALFARNRYAAWITITLEMDPLPEQELLCWSNHIAEPTGRHTGFTWANHHSPDAGPVLTHYLAFEPGRWGHFKLLLGAPDALIKRCIAHTSVVLGRDITKNVRRVMIQKLGHSMPCPVPGSMRGDPNQARKHERVLYAGVDTGRLPLASEAIDSAMVAVRQVRSVL